MGREARRLSGKAPRRLAIAGIGWAPARAARPAATRAPVGAMVANPRRGSARNFHTTLEHRGAVSRRPENAAVTRGCAPPGHRPSRLRSRSSWGAKFLVLGRQVPTRWDLVGAG